MFPWFSKYYDFSAKWRCYFPFLRSVFANEFLFFGHHFHQFGFSKDHFSINFRSLSAFGYRLHASCNSKRCNKKIENRASYTDATFLNVNFTEVYYDGVEINWNTNYDSYGEGYSVGVGKGSTPKVWTFYTVGGHHFGALIFRPFGQCLVFISIKPSAPQFTDNVFGWSHRGHFSGTPTPNNVVHGTLITFVLKYLSRKRCPEGLSH